MKIAIIIYSLQSGGAEKVAADLSLEFAKNHQVDLMWQQQIGMLPLDELHQKPLKPQN